MRRIQDISQAALNASGNGTNRVQNNNAATVWKIEQFSLITNPIGSSACTCVMQPTTGVIDTSYFAGTGDVAGGDPPMWIFTGDYVDFIWTGGPANGSGIVTYFGWELTADEYSRLQVAA